VRALREGRLSLFAAALARLGAFEPEQIRQALASPRPDLLQIACATVGVDRSAFPAILRMVRALNEGRPGLPARAAGEVVFVEPPRRVAAV
jgi:hypothetical protein